MPATAPDPRDRRRSCSARARPPATGRRRTRLGRELERVRPALVLQQPIASLAAISAYVVTSYDRLQIHREGYDDKTVLDLHIRGSLGLRRPRLGSRAYPRPSP